MNDNKRVVAAVVATTTTMKTTTDGDDNYPPHSRMMFNIQSSRLSGWDGKKERSNRRSRKRGGKEIRGALC